MAHMLLLNGPRETPTPDYYSMVSLSSSSFMIRMRLNKQNSLLSFAFVLDFVFVKKCAAAESSMWRLGLGSEAYPQRAGAPDCAYYMRTGVCGYGSRCRFNHPPDRASVQSSFFCLICNVGF